MSLEELCYDLNKVKINHGGGKNYKNKPILKVQNSKMKFSTIGEKIISERPFKMTKPFVSSKIVVSNISPDVTEEELRALFEKFSPIKLLDFFTDDSDLRTADVIFRKPEDALTAKKECYGMILKENIIYIKYETLKVAHGKSRPRKCDKLCK